MYPPIDRFFATAAEAEALALSLQERGGQVTASYPLRQGGHVVCIKLKGRHFNIIYDPKKEPRCLNLP